MGSCRFVYNLALETKNHAYASHRKNLSCFELIKQLPELKKECEWLKEVNSSSLQQAIVDLDKAFTSFFKGRSKFPNFKKKSGKQSYRNPHGKEILIKENMIFFPKFREGVKLIQDRKFKGTIKNTTISKTPTGKYFISVLVETGKDNPKPQKVKPETSIGIDLGITSFAVTSNGELVNNPKYLRKAMLHLKYLQRQVSKKKKGGSNRKKAVYKLALQHERVTNKRKDFLHKLSTDLIKNHDTICLEDLNIAGMVKNHSLAGAIGDASWSEFVRQLKYKAEWSGKNVLQIPTFEPSTKICNVCGATNHTLTLADREWACVCGVNHDRDINAAINIKNYCLKNYSGKASRQKSVELPTLVGAMKQKDKLSEN